MILLKLSLFYCLWTVPIYFHSLLVYLLLFFMVINFMQQIILILKIYYIMKQSIIANTTRQAPAYHDSKRTSGLRE